MTANLVIVRAGAGSLHGRWIDAAAPRSFDLLVAAFSPGAETVEGPGIRRIDLPGWKVSGYARLFAEMPELLADYDRIALIDDDIAADQAALDRSFAIGAERKLRLWQPSLSWDSHFSHACFLRNPAFKLRYINFVEMMCPFFDTGYLRRVLPLFGLGYETGIDLVWTRMMDDPWLKAAVLDAVTVRHTKPVGAEKHLQGFDRNERYDARMASLVERFGTAHRGGICYAAETTGGRTTFSRWAIAASTLRLLAAVRQTPMTTKACLKLVGATIRHTALRPLDLGPIPAPQLPVAA